MSRLTSLEKVLHFKSKSNTFLRGEPMFITEKGQVTIPIDIREKFGFLPHTEIQFKVRRQQVVLQKVITATKKQNSRNPFQALVGIAAGRMTTDEIMALTRGKD